MCLGMFLLGFILYGTLCASWTWLTISFVGDIFDYQIRSNQISRSVVSDSFRLLEEKKKRSEKIFEETIEAVYCHHVYLTYTQSTSWETLEEAQAGIKIAGRNINNLRYADDPTLMAESEEELKSLLMKVLWLI